jgi:FAD/FMN-containing dehydrogenase
MARSEAGSEYQSWGRVVHARHRVVPVHWRSEDPFARAAGPVLPYGLGRSYGDSCLNDGGVLLAMRGLDRFVSFDPARGLLACEAGVSLGQILELVVPRGFFLPVVPGTKHVTVGGAIANDVHGKNHHRAGTFGAHVVALELRRSTGERLVCSREQNRPLFEATIGGLGLTGIVLSATIRLEPIPSDRVRVETVPLPALDAFFELSGASDLENAFTVAWVDCLAPRGRLGRGILYRGNWDADAPRSPPRRAPSRARLSVPFELPVSPLNRLTLRAFNAAYYTRQRLGAGVRSVAYEPFFFPLDGVERWNRIYGRRGLLQFQCAIPHAAAQAALRALLGAIGESGEGSFLAVLKNFGPARSPGLLSFPREGVTLALDFAERGEPTARLFRELYAIVAAHRGRLYPAKDGQMPPAQFEAQYADVLPAFRAQLDPAFSSSFWRRVTARG